MTLSPLAQSLVDAAVALAREDGPRFFAALKAHDWRAAGTDVILAELKLAAAAGLRGAEIALRLAPLAAAIHMRPADPASPAMSRATGGEGVQNVSTGA